MNLLIVESPAKAKTIEKYLGSDYKVLASFGHVRDLPKDELGVEVKENYKPTYIIVPKAKKILAEIKSQAEKAKILYLATDLDREGEAISWHLLEALKLKNKDKAKRIVFNEITKSALEKAVKNPREIDLNLVNAQQARRVLDRLVGYKLSPFLWKKVKAGLSAGRVQSVAVRLVVEREKEIKGFKPEEFWVLGAKLSKKDDELKFIAYLVEKNGKALAKFDINKKSEADNFVAGLEKATYTVINIEQNESPRKPSAPFTTSTLQMEASRKLGFSPKQTMMLAQQLYESGHITYMRTDSTTFSTEAISSIKKIITSQYGEKYLNADTRVYQTKTRNAQEAHEAIRPTHFDKTEVTDDARGQRLYDLIWKRSVASQMADAIFTVQKVKIEAKTKDTFIFQVIGEIMKFDGFIKAYVESSDDEVTVEENKIPKLTLKEILQFHELIKDQKFTEPPKRYSEATLVKKLESLGIGRPSTYAPTLDTIQERGYVELIEKKFQPQEIGTIVTDLLVEHFPKVVDYQFTAKMEDEFDEIAEGKLEWTKAIDEFYQPFSKNLTEKNKEVKKDDIIKPEELKEKCPECGKILLARLGRFGKFIACSGYPDCKYSRPFETKAEQKSGKVVGDDGKMETVKQAEEQKCEKCGGKMVLKEGRFGKFLACENYPKCKNTKTVVEKTGIKCPDCEKGDVISRRTKKGRTFWGCSRYPECKYATWQDPADPKKEAEPKADDSVSEKAKDQAESPEIKN